MCVISFKTCLSGNRKKQNSFKIMIFNTSGFSDGQLNTPFPFSDGDQYEILVQHNLLRQELDPVGSNVECIIVIFPINLIFLKLKRKNSIS